MTAVCITLDDVRAALALESFDVKSAWRRMASRPDRADFPFPAEPDDSTRMAGVLALVHPLPGTTPEDNTLALLLIQRQPDPGVHSGQMAFPGGSWEPGDEDYVQTALRETCEEVGACAEDITILGQLTPVFIPPSNFLVHPSVGYTAQCPQWQLNPAEVAAVVEFPLADLINDSVKRREPWNFNGHTVSVPYYDVSGYTVWGATAIMLSELEWRLRTVLGLSQGDAP